eukprot:3605865-Prymnesium_polylepis.1
MGGEPSHVGNVVGPRMPHVAVARSELQDRGSGSPWGGRWSVASCEPLESCARSASVPRSGS